MGRRKERDGKGRRAWEVGGEEEKKGSKSKTGEGEELKGVGSPCPLFRQGSLDFRSAQEAAASLGCLQTHH